MSSAGLVYKHFGKEVLRTICDIYKAPISDDDLESLYKKIYNKLI